MDLARAPRRTARKKGSGYENDAHRHAHPCSQGFSVEALGMQISSAGISIGSLYFFLCDWDEEQDFCPS
jgi:hypothetical protein